LTKCTNKEKSQINGWWQKTIPIFKNKGKKDILKIIVLLPICAVRQIFLKNLFTKEYSKSKTKQG
jgi:hypothetical protein